MDIEFPKFIVLVEPSDYPWILRWVHQKAAQASLVDVLGWFGLALWQENEANNLMDFLHGQAIHFKLLVDYSPRVIPPTPPAPPSSPEMSLPLGVRGEPDGAESTG